MIQGSDGNFYGLTASGGANGPSGSGILREGTFYQVTPAGVETVLYTFTNSQMKSQGPEGPLIQTSDGNFYGTAGGGAHSSGTVFKLSLSTSSGSSSSSSSSGGSSSSSSSSSGASSSSSSSGGSSSGGIPVGAPGGGCCSKGGAFDPLLALPLLGFAALRRRRQRSQ